jgi:hypothetical protein
MLVDLRFTRGPAGELFRDTAEHFGPAGPHSITHGDQSNRRGFYATAKRPAVDNQILHRLTNEPRKHWIDRTDQISLCFHPLVMGLDQGDSTLRQLMRSQQFSSAVSVQVPL